MLKYSKDNSKWCMKVCMTNLLLPNQVITKCVTGYKPGSRLLRLLILDTELVWILQKEIICYVFVQSCVERISPQLSLHACSSCICVLQALLHNKAGSELLDANDMYGNTPLHIAAQEGYIDCVKVRIVITLV